MSDRIKCSRRKQNGQPCRTLAITRGWPAGAGPNPGSCAIHLTDDEHVALKSARVVERSRATESEAQDRRAAEALAASSVFGSVFSASPGGPGAAKFAANLMVTVDRYVGEVFEHNNRETALETLRTSRLGRVAALIAGEQPKR